MLAVAVFSRSACQLERRAAAAADGALEGQRPGMRLVHRRDIVQPVEIGQRLKIGLVLDQLLRAAVQQPDVRLGSQDGLALELEHEPQHAVRRGVLRPKVDGEVLDFL